jgi:di/tricarboxylate transporter
MRFANRYNINPLLMGLMIINGASAGGFSPMSIFGGITNGVVKKAGLPGDPTTLFLGSFFFNLAISLVVFFLWGGRDLLGRRADDTGGEPAEAGADRPGGETLAGGQSSGAPSGGAATATTATTEVDESIALDRDRILTLIGLVSLAVGALFFDLNVGLVAITVGVVLSLISPASAKDSVSQIAWPTVLLVCGIVTYVSVMQEIGTIKWLGNEVATIGAPLLAALVICFIGGAVSAFASTTGILGALIPLAVPFLTGSASIGAVGVITALAISSSVVDSSPFSTSGALVVANAPEDQRDGVYKGLIRWGFSMVVIAPIATWAVLVVPGWL